MEQSEVDVPWGGTLGHREAFPWAGKAAPGFRDGGPALGFHRRNFTPRAKEEAQVTWFRSCISYGGPRRLQGDYQFYHLDTCQNMTRAVFKRATIELVMARYATTALLLLALRSHV